MVDAAAPADPAPGDPQGMVPLQAEIRALRAELQRLREGLAPVGSATGAEQATLLWQVNEQLVMAVLRAEAAAQEAVTQSRVFEQSSHRDPLTGLPNRPLMADRLDKAIAAAWRDHERLALFFVDVDDFKRVNDTLGHPTGDAVLRLVAQRLESVVRGSDTVSRYGGDEFLVLLANVTMASDAAMMADKMLLAIAAPCSVNGAVLRVSASIGIALFPEDGENAAALIQWADAAMYESKRKGHGGFAFRH
jgi:diguanylate cyclase (GGDEF)-like protein